jgi:hypothetical protein
VKEKYLSAVLIVLFAGCLGPALHAATLEITNEPLAVRYDDGAHAFSVTDRASGRTFLTNGKLEGGHQKAQVNGQTIVVTQPGGTVTLELRGDTPFVFVRQERRNTGTKQADIPKAVPTTFTVELGKSAHALRVMGTGGLFAPDDSPGSYLFLTCADPVTRHGVVAGWVTQDRGCGAVFSTVKNGKVVFKAQIDYGHLRIPPGQSAALETLAVGYFADTRIGAERYADLIQKQYDIKLRPRTAVYCTWYAGKKYGGAGDEKSTVQLAKFVAKTLQPFGLDVIQIDDRWQAGKQMNGPASEFDRVKPGGPYKRGIAPVAKEVDKLGLTLGLWWLPFGRHHTTGPWKHRQDWFARWTNGKPMRTRQFGGTCLDLTHPKVQKHLATIAKLYRSWGVKYYKMDGLWTGTATDLVYGKHDRKFNAYADDDMSNCAPFHDRSKTQIEAYRDGLKLLRKSAGNDVFFSGCCMSQNMRSMCSMGLLDSMRVGPDYGHDGQGIKTGPIYSSRLYFLNGRTWWNDPDPTRPTAAPHSARLSASYTAITGQFFLLSDWLPSLPPDRIEMLKRTMLSHDGVARPVDWFDNPLPYLWLLTDDKTGTRRDVIGLFNWESKPKKLGATLAKTGLDPAKTYHAFDFWDNTLLPDIKGDYAYTLPAASCQIIAVRAAAGHPVLLSTSRHVTQGIVDAERETWDAASATLSGAEKLIAGDPCELRLRVPAGWKLDKASAPAVESEGLVRLKLESATSQTVNWSATFRQGQ